MRLFRFRFLVGVVLLFWFVAGGVIARQDDPRTGGSVLRATRASGPIKLDGRLDDDAWREANMAVELVQQSPKPYVNAA